MGWIDYVIKLNHEILRKIYSDTLAMSGTGVLAIEVTYNLNKLLTKGNS